MIESFSGPHRFLSNFYPASVVLDEVRFPSVEHAYQAAKTLDPAWRALIRALPVPAQAKAMGREVPLRPRWDDLKIDAMRDLLRQKFRDPDLRARLLATGDQVLIEGNWWHDTFWGVCRGVGENHLGRLLMEVRDEIRRRASAGR